jgi:glycosyltransferase involved in cell wall biosynthesis
VDRPILVYVGSLNPARGALDLILSFRHVLKCFPKALLYISHPEREGEEFHQTNLQRLVGSYKMQSNVTIKGLNPHIEEIFNLADAVVLPFVRPYWVDPPLVLLEAMSTGASIITTPVGSTMEIIRNHQNAVLTEPGNRLALADEIIANLENPQEARKMGEEARKTIVRNYSYEKVGKRLSNVYNFILQHFD